MSNFQKDVIERSQTIPVLVDFWAPWCGPCRVLGPVLDELASEHEGKWELVKINTEEDQETAMQFNIRSIPHVKLFSRGEIAGEFTGALSKPMIERFLEEHLPNQALNDLQALINDYPEGSPELLEQLDLLHQAFPNQEEVAIELAQRLVWSEPEKAISLISGISQRHKLYEAVKDIHTLAEIAAVDDGTSLAGKHMIAAKEALLKGNNEAGIQSIINAVIADKHFADDLPRRAAIALFHSWGEAHPLTKAKRRAFSMALN